MLGFEGLDATDALSRLQRIPAGGVVLFKRNCESLDQICDLNAEICASSSNPIVAIDHEGPRVNRLRGLIPDTDGAQTLGEKNDLLHTEAVGQEMGQRLHSLGIHLDFAPVLDLEEIPDHPALKGRCFHSEPGAVADHASALIRGLHTAGVGTCAKHFPGHGSAPLDSHVDLPESPRSIESLHMRDILPYSAAIQSGVDLVMTAHVRFPAIDTRPATCSERILGGLLRDKLGYDGPIITDDCDMEGFRRVGPIRDTVAQAVMAGVDIILCCRDPQVQDEAFAGLYDLYQRDSEGRARLETSLRRVAQMKQSLVQRFSEV